MSGPLLWALLGLQNTTWRRWFVPIANIVMPVIVMLALSAATPALLPNVSGAALGVIISIVVWLLVGRWIMRLLHLNMGLVGTLSTFGVGCGIALALLVAFNVDAVYDSGPGAGWGVHVCTRAHYDSHNVMCKVNDASIAARQLNDAYLTITGKNGGDFGTTTITITVSTQDTQGGAWLHGGWTSTNVSVSDNVDALSLKSTFATALVVVENKATYQIEAEAGHTSLGTATFTYHDQ